MGTTSSSTSCLHTFSSNAHGGHWNLRSGCAREWHSSAPKQKGWSVVSSVQDAVFSAVKASMSLQWCVCVCYVLVMRQLHLWYLNMLM